MGAGRNTDNRSGKEGRSEIERYKKDLQQSRNNVEEEIRANLPSTFPEHV